MLNLHAFTLRKVAPEIRGSIINSVFQDEGGLMWIGTNVGISKYNGKNTDFLAGFNGVNHIQGTIYGEIAAETLYGLKIFNEKCDSVATFEMFTNVAYSASDNKGTLFIMQRNGSVYYKTNSSENFDNIVVPDLIADNIKYFSIDSTGMLRIITREGKVRKFGIVYTNESINLQEKPHQKFSSGIQFCFESEGNLYIIDNEYKLYELNPQTDQLFEKVNLKPFLQNKGKLTAGIIFKNEFYFGTENGLLAIRQDGTEDILLKAEVTTILKDRFQDFIWIGTSGEGLYTYSYDPYTIKSNLFSSFAPSVSKPITAIHLTTEGSLFLGTEGNGILVLPDYNSDREITNVKLLSSRNGLPDDSVYVFHGSHKGVWIGCKSGLAFYSYKTKTIDKINISPYKNIRAIAEGGSALWVSSYGKGVVRASITYNNDIPELTNPIFYSLNNEDEVSNRFSSFYINNTNILFINDGNGIFRLVGDDLVLLTGNDLKSVHNLLRLDRDNYIASTDFGIFRLNLGQNEITSAQLLDERTSKDMLPGDYHDYWLSTDDGLALYNTYWNTIRYFDHSYGLDVSEYNSKASFKDASGGVIFFGGINGFTTVKYNVYDEAMDYMPMLSAEKLTVFGIDRNMDDFRNDGSDGLVFNSDENFFSVSFSAIDYINGNNYIYYYKIGNGQWVDNGSSETVSFTDVGPGHYDLYMKYYNKMLNKESYTKKLSIQVLPPWYRSVYAYIAYFVLLMIALYLVIYFMLRRKRKRKEEESIKAEQIRREEIYEAKLDFFTDIAHEFCTPLTLIYGPCNRILDQKNINPSVLKYVNVIDRNAKRMNSLINDLMEFKQIESGHKQPDIRSIPVSEIADSVIDAFKLDASGSKIYIYKQYPPGIVWNSDENFLVTILTNLVSNAIKYSSDGIAEVAIAHEQDHLIIEVSNKGKGIRKESIETIFNRYAVLNNMEQHDGWHKNGLGLAVTAGMVKLLHGNIKVDSIPGDTTTFTINLPAIEEQRTDAAMNTPVTKPFDSNISLPATRYVYKDEWNTVAVIDDDAEMLWFICDVLNDEFNVIPVNDPSHVSEVLATKHTDIIICDIMMENMNGIELAGRLKADKSTSHIPLIIVSAVHETEKQTEAIDAGAELYVTKPFNTEYLKSVVKRLLGRKEDLKDYFASPLSAFEVNMGKLQHVEHRKFIKKITAIINKNIQNENLSPAFIASELGMSSRSLYRKLKDAGSISLHEMILEGRITTAENLLLKSKLTIDEIVFKSGFSNRASFYRAFSKKHNCSPTDFVGNNGL